MLTYKEQQEALKKIKSGLSKYEIFREFEISNSATRKKSLRNQVMMKFRMLLW